MNEFYNPNDFREFLGSMARFAVCAKDTAELLWKIKDSDNFSIINKRVKAESIFTYLKRIIMSYGDVAVLLYDDQYEEAGELFIKSVFPKKYKMRSNIEWDL